MNNEYIRAKNDFEKGNISKASAQLETMVEQGITNEEIIYLLGVCRFRQRKFEDARGLFISLLATNNSHINAHYYLGLSHERLGDEKSARTEYRFTLALKPDHKLAQKKLGQNVIQQEATSPQREASQASNRAQENGEQVSTDPGDLIYSGHRKPWTMLHIPALIIVLAAIKLLFIVENGPGLVEGFLFALQSIRGLSLEPVIPVYLVPTLIFIDLIFRSIATKYKIYQKRIDVRYGYLMRKEYSIWTFEIESVEFRRNLWLILSNSGQILMKAKGIETTIDGIGRAKFMRQLWSEMRDAALVDRRSMKKWWI
ncbi:tetratricopeptide repeat protein [Parasphingorhabdus sp.]|uniref:tetratricopeptide repeat protein n=1 Tax=Parasphingorhabdus sp. TaxID=2709688 RepID=UPI003BB1123C